MNEWSELVPGEGFEPPLTVSETAVLPLNYPGLCAHARSRTEPFPLATGRSST